MGGINFPCRGREAPQAHWAKIVKSASTTCQASGQRPCGASLLSQLRSGESLPAPALESVRVITGRCFGGRSSPPGTGGVARSAGVVAHTPSAGVLSGRLFVSDHPVRSFQARTPLLYQEGIFARRNFFAHLYKPWSSAHFHRLGHQPHSRKPQ